MLRVGLGATLLERAQNGGRLDGIGIYAQSLWRELAELPDVEVSPVCFPPKPWQKKLERVLPGREPFPLSYGLSAALARVTGCAFPGTRRMAAKLNLYHATDHLIPRLRGLPVVATICDALVVERPDWVNAGPAAFRSRLFRGAARWADHVIAISHAMVPALVEHLGVRRDAVSVVHLGVDERWFERVPQDRRREVLERHGVRKPYFLFVGTLQPRKNVERLMAAYEALPPDIRDAHLLVVAGQAGWASAQTVEALRRMQAQGRAAWLEYVPQEDLFALYQGAAAFVFPSLAEGFGMPVLEAFASRVPVITSNTSSLPEVAGDAALLVDPTSVEAISESMAKVANSAAEVAGLVERGYARARAMSWARCAEQTLATYRKVL